MSVIAGYCRASRRSSNSVAIYYLLQQQKNFDENMQNPDFNTIFWKNGARQSASNRTVLLLQLPNTASVVQARFRETQACLA